MLKAWREIPTCGTEREEKGKTDSPEKNIAFEMPIGNRFKDKGVFIPGSFPSNPKGLHLYPALQY